ncbi:MAG: hypothetical protein HQK79_17510 [Desulfobacterales bacterium]|nr:hypothetical protein [Desulfobacterales bacterium]
MTKTNLIIAIIGWIIAAIIIAGYNVFMFIEVSNPSIAPGANNANLAAKKIAQVTEIKTQSLKELLNIDLDKIFSRITPELSGKLIKPKEIKEQIETKEPSKEQIEIKPPNLNGILSIIDTNGNYRNMALIEGKMLEEKQIVNNFTIHKITKEGVVVSKGEKTWFMPAPEVFFSMVYGG